MLQLLQRMCSGWRSRCCLQSGHTRLFLTLWVRPHLKSPVVMVVPAQAQAQAQAQGVVKVAVAVPLLWWNRAQLVRLGRCQVAVARPPHHGSQGKDNKRRPGGCSLLCHYAVRRMMCTPLSVSTMSLSSPTFNPNLEAPRTGEASRQT